MINAIFAVDRYGGMGFNGTLPWPHNACDMAQFKKHTDGHVVVMGRKTWDDPKMPKPLPGRTTYVATNRPVYHAGQIKGNITERVLELEQKHPDKTIWVIGGPELIKNCIGIVDRLYLTHFKGSYKIDTRIDLKSTLLGFHPVRAEVAKDFESTLVIYEPIFKRTPTSS